MGLRSARIGAVQLAHHPARTRLGQHIRLERYRHPTRPPLGYDVAGRPDAGSRLIRILSFVRKTVSGCGSAILECTKSPRSRSVWCTSCSRARCPEDLASLKDGTQPNVWVRIQNDPRAITELENDLTALYIAGASAPDSFRRRRSARDCAFAR